MYDELVKSLRELCEMTALCDDYSCFECPYEEECGRYKSQRLSAVYRQAADAIEELSRENESLAKSVNEASEILRKRWIPVTERLPEKYVNVLVFLHSLDWNSIYYSIDHLMDDGQWWKASTSWKHEVTHWMPLPTPPKEEAT